MIRRTCAAVRSMFSRFSAAAIASTLGAVTGSHLRSLGSSASNPPCCQARIHLSRVFRDTCTGRARRARVHLPGDAADQPAPLPGRQRRVSGLPDQPVPEQADRPARAARLRLPLPPCSCPQREPPRSRRRMNGTPSRAARAARKGQLVLRPAAGQPGASSSPPSPPRPPPQRHRAHPRASAAPPRAAPATAATAAATGPAAAAGITGSGLVRASAVKNARTCSARPANRRSQPRTVEAGRPSPRDRAVPGPGRRGLQRRPDHLARIGPPGQAPRRQQHMRRPALPAPRPARDQPRIRPVQEPHPPPPGMPPPAQHPAARRAGQLPARQLPLDQCPVTVYREHDASERQPSGPPRVLRQKDNGEGRAHPT